jgi:hypothetical protein
MIAILYLSIRKFFPLLVMTKTYLIAFVLVVVCICTGFSQDEGVLTKKVRITNGKSFIFSTGPSFRFNNKSDYSPGLYFEAGYLTRLNRLVSIGGSLSFTKLNFDQELSDSYADSKAIGNNLFQEDGGYEVYAVYMDGGNLNFYAAAFDLRIDFSPYNEENKVSVYGHIKPFVLASSRSEVSATTYLWYPNNNPFEPPPWDPAVSGGVLYETIAATDEGREGWAAKTEFAGGIGIGIGVDYTLSSKLKLFLQPALRFTSPITHIKTNEFPRLRNNGYNNPEYPFAKKGFSTLTVALGLAYSF